jgi:hypothetical protein
MFHDFILFQLFFGPEHGYDMFLRNDNLHRTKPQRVQHFITISLRITNHGGGGLACTGIALFTLCIADSNMKCL